MISSLTSLLLIWPEPAGALAMLAMLDMGQLAITLAGGSSAGLLLYALLSHPMEDDLATDARYAAAFARTDRDTIFEWPAARPVVRMALAVARRIGLPGLRERIRTDLNASGNPTGYSVNETLAICVLTAGTLAVLGGVLGSVLSPAWVPIILIVMAGLGFYAPLWSLHDQAKVRLTRISKQLPYTLDLIGLMLAAGSTFTEAAQVMIRDRPEDDLNQELALVLAEMEYGTSRSDALQHLSDRIPIDTIRSLVGAINQSESLGTPLTQILDSQANMIRVTRSVRAEKLSSSASLRLLLPGTLILLAVVLILFGPIVLNIIRGGFGA